MRLASPARLSWGFRRRVLPVLALSLSLVGAAESAAAGEGPTAPDVVSGSVAFSATPGALGINQTTNKAIINWSDFSIPAGFEVSINNGTGATLNRVVGSEVSNLNGLLSSTGSVYVINPNGVIVGKNGVVNTAGRFVASTLDLGDINFLTGGPLQFHGGSSAGVVNLGRISSGGGDVALIGATVENQGQLLAPGGVAALGAGSRLVLSEGGDPKGRLLSVDIGVPGTSVTNSGLIEAAAVELRTQGGNIYALAGNASGVIRATGIESRDGRILLISDQGTTSVEGVLEAKGAGGTPGEIETSGLVMQVGTAQVDTHGGTWLIDPTDLDIDSIAAGSIVAALNAGTNVTQQTVGTIGQYGLASTGNGDIFVSYPLAWTGSGILTLDAWRTVDVQEAINVNGSGGVVIRYGSGDPTGELRFSSGTLGFSMTNPAQSLSINNQSYTLVRTLDGLFTAANAAPSGRYALASSVTHSGPAYGTPIPTFSGVLEGLGNTITNLNVQAPNLNNVGLVGDLSGTIRDLRLYGGTVHGQQYVGAFAGFSTGSILNVVTTNMYIYGSYAYIGGIVGWSQGGTVRRAVADSYIFSNSVNPGLANYFGGLVGFNANNSQILDSYAFGSITGGDFVGGITGRNSPGSVISNIRAQVNVSAVSYFSNGVAVSSPTVAVSDSGSSIINSGTGAVVSALAMVRPVGPFTRITVTPVNWSVADASSDYGTLAILGAGALSGVLTPDVGNVAAVVGLTTTLGAPVTLTNRLPAGSYRQIVTGLTGTASASYALATTGNTVGTLIVRPLALTGTLSAGSSLYGASLSPGTLTFTNLVSGDSVNGGTVVVNISGLTSTSGKLIVGTHTGIASVGSTLSGTDAANYTFAGATGNYTVQAATLTPSLTGSVTKPYDGTLTATLTGANYALAGVVTGDVVTLNNPTSGLYDTKAVGSGKTVTVTGLTKGGADAGNYLLGTSVSGAVGQINPKTLTASLTGSVAKTFDGNTAATLGAGNYALAGVVSGDAVTLSSPASGTYDTRSAGSGKTVTATGLGLGGLDAGNYTLAATVSGGVGQINPKALTASLTGAVTKTYDGSTAATLGTSSYTLVGLVGGDTVTLNAASGAYDTKTVGTGKTVTFTGLGLGGADGGNYSVASTISGTVGQVNAKALTATLSGPVTKTYDGTTTATLSTGSYALGGVASGDAVALSATSGAYDTKTAGSGKGVTFSGLALTGGDAGNYTVSTSVSGAVGQINPKILTAALTGLVSKTYDGTATATLTADNYALSGMVSGDTVMLIISTSGLYDTALAGSGKTVTVADLGLGGADRANYTVSATVSGAVGRIIPAASQISSAGSLASPSPLSQLLQGAGRPGAASGPLVTFAPALTQISGLAPASLPASTPPGAGGPAAAPTQLAAAGGTPPQTGASPVGPAPSSSSPAATGAAQLAARSVAASSGRSGVGSAANRSAAQSKSGGRAAVQPRTGQAVAKASLRPKPLTEVQIKYAKRVAAVAAATKVAARRGNESQPGDQMAETFHDNVWLDNSSLDNAGKSHASQKLEETQSLSSLLATFILILVP